MDIQTNVQWNVQAAMTTLSALSYVIAAPLSRATLNELHTLLSQLVVQPIFAQLRSNV